MSHPLMSYGITLKLNILICKFALYSTVGSCSSDKLGTLNFTKVAANDDEGALNYASKIMNAAVSAGNTYLLQVDGTGYDEWNGATYSEGRINVRSSCSLPNDSFYTLKCLEQQQNVIPYHRKSSPTLVPPVKMANQVLGLALARTILVHPKMAGVQMTLMFKTLFGISSM
jgi:hypothetical protein